MNGSQPNILLIVSDQMRGDCLSAEGHPALLTPNLDEMAGTGTLFHRAYSTCPSCVPARRALLTGQHPATNGLVGMQAGWPIHTTTFPEVLRNAGYQTHLAGRTMHQHPPSKRYGYDHMVLGSTYATDDEYAAYIEANAPDTLGVRGMGLTPNGWTACPWPHASHTHPTEWTTRQSLNFLKHRDETCPCFLTASYFAPHPPLTPPAFYMDRYLRQTLPEPAIGSWAQPPEAAGFAYGVDSARVNLTSEALRSTQAGYFGLINHLDDQLYWLMREFRQISEQQQRSWLIVFTSDHGEMLGDHYHWRKCEPYEGSARIPLLVRGSADLGLKTGQRLNSPVCLEDIMPTLIDLAGADIPEGIDGRSLAPMLRGESTGVRSVLHGEHAPQYSAEQAHHYLTDGHSKYIWRPLDGREQLFSLDDDPHELADLAQQPGNKAQVQQWRQRLIAHLADRPERFTDGQRLIPGRDYTKALPHLLNCKDMA